MKVYFMLSRNGFVAIICTVLLVFLLCGQFKSSLISEPFDGATNKSRVDYISSLGYDVLESPASVKETLVPERYGEAYANYLFFQTSAGFPLENYKGQKAVIYEYEQNEGSVITLIVAQDKIIGGHITDGKTKTLQPLIKKGK